ncbi:MAG TPA: acyl carrier protein [Spirochaetia bacterium]|nr:acyl carrier protein [Spirochaetia bacterium]
MISERLKKVILKALELEEFPLDDTTIADTVPGWDSLNHARIIRAVEREYGVHFTTAEVVRLANVGELQALLDRKLP